MKAVTWQGKRDIRVIEVPDPVISEPDDIIVRITSSGLCGSDLHLYEVLGPFMSEGDVLGHEPMGIVEEVGPEVTAVRVGDRVVIPFTISCGTCWMCERNLYSQCETTQNTEHGTGASLFGYSKLYGQVPGGQAEYLRVPFGNTLPIKVPHGPPDDRFLYLSDVLPTAWQGLQYANLAPESTLLVLGAGPIGDMVTRLAVHQGHQVFTVDRVPERLARVTSRGATAIDFSDGHDVAEHLRGLTDGRGADAVIDAVGMEAHGSPVAEKLTKLVGMLPSALGQPLMTTAGVDRLAAFYTAIDAVRRGGTVSLLGVYGGALDPLPMMSMFDKQLQVRMGQANVHAWIDDLLPFLVDDDPLGVDDFATHRVPLDAAPEVYATFQAKGDAMVKTVFTP